MSVNQHEDDVSSSSATFIVSDVPQDDNSEKGVVHEVQACEKSADVPVA